MKSKFLFAILTLFVFLIQCKSKKPVVETATVEKENTTEQKKTNELGVRLKIVRVSCASIVATIEDEKYKSLGEEWVPYNVRMKEPYKHAVTISNKCAVPSEIKENDVIVVKLINEVSDKDCEICLMMDYPPAKSVYIKYLSRAVKEKTM